MLREDRRVVDHHVERAAEGARRRVHEIPDGGRIADVPPDHDVPLSLEFGDQTVGEVGRVAVVDGDPVAGGGERTRGGTADTA
ncbi:hypothetical protein GCM10009557_25400 [Virgisporangium ochraceum]